MQFTRIHRADWIATGEAPVDIRAAGDGVEVQVLLDLAVDVFESLRRQRRSGLRDLPQRRHIVFPAGSHPRGAEGIEIGGAGPKDRHALIRNQLPHRPGVRVGGTAIVEQHGRPNRQGREEPVPHHPAARRDVGDHVAALQVRVQEEFLQVVDQDAPRALHHGLWSPRRTGGEHDVHGMVEG